MDLSRLGGNADVSFTRDISDMTRKRRNKAVFSREPVEVEVEGLSHDGRGIAHINDKVVFIDGALPDERVLFEYVASHRNFDEAKTLKVLAASSLRVEPRCPHFGECGGCSLQHLDPDAQIRMKEDILVNQLARTGKVVAASLLKPVMAESWGYRKKARLGVRYVQKKERVLVGFREKHSRYLADIHICEVLDARVGHKLDALAGLIRSLHAYQSIAQVEVAIGEQVVALVFRNLVELDRHDRELLVSFARQHDYHIYLQPSGPDSIHLLFPETSELTYRLPEYEIELSFQPTDFTQVNPGINRKMVSQAIELLQLNETDRILDLYCGIGNFTLAMARKAAQVVGVEGDEELILRARSNAERNGISNAAFHVNDLSADLTSTSWSQDTYDKILLDPPRSGAQEILDLITGLGAGRIVYVSCNPATLARDAGELVGRYGYKLETCGVMDMFPHTAHVESMALFVKS